MAEGTNTKLLLHLDNDFLDAMENHIVTPGANPPAFSTTAKFGTHSANCNVVIYNALTVPTSDDFKIGTGAFSVDAWIRHINLPSSGGTNYVAHTNFGTNGFACNIYNNFGTYQMRLVIGGSQKIRSLGSAPSTSVFEHWCWNRDSSSNFKMYRDGVQQGANDTFAQDASDGAHAFTIGQTVSMYMDEFRFYKGGDGGYPAAFTPETAPYSVGGGAGGSLLLMGVG